VVQNEASSKTKEARQKSLNNVCAAFTVANSSFEIMAMCFDGAVVAAKSNYYGSGKRKQPLQLRYAIRISLFHSFIRLS